MKVSFICMARPAHTPARGTAQRDSDNKKRIASKLREIPGRHPRSGGLKPGMRRLENGRRSPHTHTRRDGKRTRTIDMTTTTQATNAAIAITRGPTKGF